MLGEGAADPDATGRGRRWSASTWPSATCTELVAALDWFEVSGDGSGWWSATATSCGCVPADRKRTTTPADTVTVDLSRARFTGRPGRAVAARLRRGGPVHAPRLLGRRTWPGWTGTACSRPTGRCWTGSRSAGRLRRPALGGVRRAGHLARLRARGRQRPAGRRSGRWACSAPTWPATPDGRWRVARVLPGESSDPRARSPLAAPGVLSSPATSLLAVDGQPVDPRPAPARCWSARRASRWS